MATRIGYSDQRFAGATVRRGSRASARRTAVSFRLHMAMCALAALAVTPLSAENAADGSPAARGSFWKRPSFGITVGTSLAPARTRHATIDNGFAELDQGPGRPRLRVPHSLTTHVRHGSVSPLLGAFAEMRLGRGFSVQVDVSYRLLPYAVASETKFGDPAEQRSFTGRYEGLRGALEMPAMVTYRFETAKWRPFVGVGPAFRIRRGRSYGARYGAVAAFGFDLLRSRRWALTPQIRYTHWGEADRPPWSAPRDRVQALAAIVF